MKYLLIAVATLLCGAQAIADVSLRQQLETIQSLSGSFEQRVVDEAGVELEVSSGNFKILQPGYFYWAIAQPDEQLLIANGETLLHYDAELETASERKLDAQQASSPLAIFADSGVSLEQHYIVTVLEANAYLLLPRVSPGGFVEAEVRFNTGLPGGMRVLDGLGNTTHIRFYEVQRNPPLQPADFVFEPPDGIDFYSHEQ